MRKITRFILALLVSLTMHSSTQYASAAPATNEQIRAIIISVVKETGVSIIGLGSWVSGKEYNDPLSGGSSDHDLRLLMPSGTSQQQAAAEWNNIRQKITDKINKTFGNKSSTVLKSVNLYPPTQLMTGVADADDALEQFKKLKQVPSLGFTGVVDENTAAKYAEGLYGEGAIAYTQDYERKAGKLFYKNGNQAYAGMTDLTHLTEGQARYTISGCVNTAKQWSDHLDDAIAEMNPKAIAKYLGRLDTDLTKARDLARCGMDSEWRGSVKTLIEQMKKLQKKPDRQALQKLIGSVRAVAAAGQRQTCILGAMQGRSSTAVAMLKEMLTVPTSKTASILDDLVKKIDLPMDQIVGGIVVALTVMQYSAIAGEEGFGEAIRKAVPMLMSFPVGLAAEIANAIIDDARSAGIDIIAGRQDAWDLMAGIYNSRRLEVDEKQGTWDLNRLVSQIHDIAKLKTLVMAKAQIAADSEMESSRQVDAQVAQRIYGRCYPVILQAWRAKREEFYAEFQSLGETLQTNTVALTASPSSAIWPKGATSVKVSVSAVSQNGIPEKQMQRMKEIAILLTGLKATTIMNYQFQPSGALGSYPNQAAISFKAPGRYTIAVNREIRVQAQGLSPQHLLAKPVITSASVDVDITKEEDKPKPVVKKPVAKPQVVVKKPVNKPETSSVAKPSVPSTPKRSWVLVDRKKHRLHWDDLWVWNSDERVSGNRYEVDARDRRDKPKDQLWVYGEPFIAWADWSDPPAQLQPGAKFTVSLSGQAANFKSPVKIDFALPDGKTREINQYNAAAGSQRVLNLEAPKAGSYVDAQGDRHYDDDTLGRKWSLMFQFDLIDLLITYEYIYELR